MTNQQSQFRLLANSLADFRDRVARANNTMRDAVEQYVAMMDAVGTAFALHYADMPAQDREKMLAVFNLLAQAVEIWSDDIPPASEANVVRLPDKDSPR